MYDNGQRVVQNQAEASKWFRKAAEQGDADVQFNIGISYHTGQSVSQDFAKVLRWYRMAAEQGLAEAQLNIGISY